MFGYRAKGNCLVLSYGAHACKREPERISWWYLLLKGKIFRTSDLSRWRTQLIRHILKHVYHTINQKCEKIFPFRSRYHQELRSGSRLQTSASKTTPNNFPYPITQTLQPQNPLLNLINIWLTKSNIHFQFQFNWNRLISNLESNNGNNCSFLDLNNSNIRSSIHNYKTDFVNESMWTSKEECNVGWLTKNQNAQVHLDFSRKMEIFYFNNDKELSHIHEHFLLFYTNRMEFLKKRDERLETAKQTYRSKKNQNWYF